MMYVLIQSFWQYVDKPGWLWRELNQNSYGVYIIHVIVMGGIALLLLNVAVPPFLKYIILTIMTIVVSNLVISLYRWAAKSLRQTADGGQPQVVAASR